MKFETLLSLKILSLISLIFLNSLIFAQGLNEQTSQDGFEVNRKLINFAPFKIKKDIFGNSISEKEIEDFNDNDREEREEEEESIIGRIWIMVLASPFYLPILLLDDDYSETLYYQKYPFENGIRFTEYDGKKWMINFTLSSQYVNKDIVGYNIKSSYKFLRLSIDPSYSYYSYNNEEKDISNFDTTILFTFAQNEFINFRTGFGYNHFENVSKYDGINWKYVICLFQKPFHLNLDNTLICYNMESKEKVEFNNDFSINFGYLYKGLEFKLGYKWFNLGEEQLNGPVLSSVFWF
jgi:hypothetical protein